MPKGLVTVESIFKKYDQEKRNKTSLVVQQEHYADLDLDPGKSLKFGKVNIDSERQDYTQLF